MRAWTSLSLLMFALATGCTKDDGDPVIEDTAPDFLNISIPFKAEVDGNAFGCNATFSDVGTTNATVEFQDFRMYISAIGLTDSTGSSTLLELDPGPFQGGGIALLDFEDGSWNCEENGTVEVHTAITGRVPNADYTGLAFTVGVPFEVNHPASQDGAAPPLDAPGMFRGPLFGHYFIKVELTSVGEPDGYPAHITSAGCSVDGASQVEDCTSPNRRTWAFSNFDPASNSVVIDLEEFLARNDVNANSVAPPPSNTETPPGCQADPNDQDCRDLFISYGLSAIEPTFITIE